MPIDLHTHRQSTNKYSILNIIAGKQVLPDWNSGKYYSIGIHPWYIDNIEQNKKLVEKTAQLQFVKAIGECGLDINSSFPLPQQIEVFEWHIHLAEKLKKPVIIHCVKYYNELIKLKNELKPTTAWIIHGFNANEPILRQCIQHDFYLSVGHQLFNPKASIFKLINLLPRDRIFLETDESNMGIDEIYSQFSFLTGIPETDAHQLIYANFAHCFKNNL